MLDGKQITANSRQFLMSWKASREAQQTREKTKYDYQDHSAGDYPAHTGKFRCCFSSMFSFAFICISIDIEY